MIEELLDALQDTKSELDCDETAEVEEIVLVVVHFVQSMVTKKNNETMCYDWEIVGAHFGRLW